MQPHAKKHDSVQNTELEFDTNETASATQEQGEQAQGFDAFDLPKVLAKSLHHMKYTTPTPIQMQAIPAVIKGKDLLASAQTGTGKTGAFIIPILAKMMLNPHDHAVIMAPTRELAAQILQVAHQMAHGHTAIKTALLIGGEGMGKQRAQLSAKPRLIIGTPGRMNDHLRSNSRMYEKTTILVLDEADRMLDMGFAPQIKEIIQTTNPKRQTLMFSATFPENIMKFAQQYLRDPVRITIEPERTSAACIKHEEWHTSEGARYGDLIRELNAREGSIIVFIKTKHGADRMGKKLQGEGLSVDVIHGGLNQRQRDRAIAGFRQGKTRIMIATDVAARGLDVPHIEHVINYDLPQVPEDYVHRIGRTGRNGKEGTALSFIMPSENGKWRAIQRILNPKQKRDEGAPRARRGDSEAGHGEGKKSFTNKKQHRKGQRFEKPSSFRPKVDEIFIDALEGNDEAPAAKSEFRFPEKNKKPFKKSFDKKPEGGFRKKWDDAPRERTSREHSPHERTPREHGADERPSRGYGERPSRGYAERPAREHAPRDYKKPAFGARPQRRDDREEMVFGEGPSERTSSERKPFDKKPFGGKKPFGEKKFFDKTKGDKPFGEKKFGEKPFRERSSDDRRQGDKPFAKKPFGGKKPFGNKKPGGGKPYGKRREG